MRTLRIFISSPGDVAEERERAKQVIEGLRRRYAGVFELKHLLWEGLPLQADMSFQQGIDIVLSAEQGVDMAVFVLWSRFGSLQDGSKHRSGTEREFDLMFAAREQSGGRRPALLVYTRSDDTSFGERLRGKPTVTQQDLIAQKAMVERFISEQFQDEATGRNLRAYHSFDRPVTFSHRLREHLTSLLDEWAGGELVQAVWDVEKDGPPFLGLEAFQPQHADVFFGREAEILEARHLLREQARKGCAFVLLSGASGSGKSSLARAGVLPALVDNELDEHVAAWRTLVVAPSELGGDPVAGLMRRLAAEEVLPELRGDDEDWRTLLEWSGRDAEVTLRLKLKEAFRRVAEKREGGVRVLVVLDQLEELLVDPVPAGGGQPMAGDAAGRRRKFLEVVEILCRSGWVWMVATVRSDFSTQVQAEPVLVRLTEGGGLMAVLAPEVDALRRIIEGPARLAGLTFEVREGQSLADRILGDVAHRAELLPLLGNLLRDLFERRAAGGVLTWAVYESLGGVEGALARKDMEVFEALRKGSEQVVEELWPLLVSQNLAGERTAMRTWASMAQLNRNARRRMVVEALVGARFLSTGVKDGEAVVALAHDSLLHLWHRPRRWLAANQDFLRERAYLRMDMDRWKASGRRKDHLLPAGRLLKTAKMLLREHGAQLDGEEIRYIRESVRAARRLGVLRTAVYGTSVTGGIVGGLGGLFLLACYYWVEMYGIPRGYAVDVWIKGGLSALKCEIVSAGQGADVAELQAVLLKARRYEVAQSARNQFESVIYIKYLERVSEQGGGAIPAELLDEGPLFIEYLGRNYEIFGDCAEQYGRLARVAMAQGSWELAGRSVADGLEMGLRAKEKTTDANFEWILNAAQEWFASEASKGDAERAQKVEKTQVLLRHCVARLKDHALQIQCEDRLLSMPEASSGDFSEAAYRAAKGGNKERAKALLEQGAARFPEDANLANMTGWALVNLEEHEAALAAFQKARVLMKTGAVGTDLLAGLSLSLWLSQREDEAVAAYIELIAQGRRLQKPADWAEAGTISGQGWPEGESKPMEALRRRVLERHPEVASGAR
jgi:hypothetical protein